MRIARTVLLAVALGVGVAAVAVPPPAAAQTQVAEIVVEGNQRIERQTVLSYMAIGAGDPMDPVLINRSLKSLYATGLFADVAFDRRGERLVVHVVENPVINRIAFEGNQRIEDETLQQEIQLRPRVVYSRTKVQQDVQRLLEVYRRSGRYAATIEPKVIQKEQSRLDLVFEINEGPKTEVRRIAFVGNQRFSGGRLREELATSESAWWRFLSQTDTYDPDRLTYDRELLRRFYLGKGYADFRIVSAVAELSRDRESFFLTFTLDEGERYRFGNIDLQNELPALETAGLRGALTIAEGEWYDADAIEKTVQALTDAVGQRGYAFVDIRPRVKRNREERIIDVTFSIQEGPRVYVDRIDISGNVRTLDHVIRREFELAEGDAFNTAKLRESEQNIRDLDFFEKVNVDYRPSDAAPDRTVVDVSVEEKSTGQLTLGLGWSSADGPLFQASIRERNLLGRGQDLSLDLSLAGKRSSINLGFTEPYFMERKVRAGFDIFYRTVDNQTASSYDETRQGFRLRAGYDLAENWGQSWAYSLAREDIRGVPVTASNMIKAEEGSELVSTVSHTLTYDRRDSRVEPTEGYVISNSTDVAGLGGSVRFVRNNFRTAQFYSFADQWVGKLDTDFGIMQGLGQDTRLNDRYYLGGRNLRGFAGAGAAPRDAATDDAIGTNWMYTVTAQLDFPLGLPEELGLTGQVYADAGMSGDIDSSPNSYILIDTTPRAAVGTGVVWESPMGPLSVGLAMPVVKESYDKEENFRINFGTRF